MTQILFPLRRALALGLSLLLIVALAACGSAGGGDPTDAAGGGDTATVTDGSVTITADKLDFSADVIEAPSGEAFTIVLENLEAVPHNISVYVEEGGDEIAKGDIINEGESSELDIPALEPGEYFFVCDLHPAEMRGVLVVEG